MTFNLDIDQILASLNNNKDKEVVVPVKKTVVKKAATPKEKAVTDTDTNTDTTVPEVLSESNLDLVAKMVTGSFVTIPSKATKKALNQWFSKNGGRFNVDMDNKRGYTEVSMGNRMYHVNHNGAHDSRYSVERIS